MRFEIVVPDSTSLDVKSQLAKLAQQLSEQPELVARIDVSEDHDAIFQRMFTPERLAHIDEAIAEVKRGVFFTDAQVDEYFAQKEASWQSPNI